MKINIKCSGDKQRCCLLQLTDDHYKQFRELQKLQKQYHKSDSNFL